MAKKATILISRPPSKDSLRWKDLWFCEFVLANPAGWQSSRLKPQQMNRIKTTCHAANQTSNRHPPLSKQLALVWWSIWIQQAQMNLYKRRQNRKKLGTLGTQTTRWNRPNLRWQARLLWAKITLVNLITAFFRRTTQIVYTPILITMMGESLIKQRALMGQQHIKTQHWSFSEAQEAWTTSFRTSTLKFSKHAKKSIACQVLYYLNRS